MVANFSKIERAGYLNVEVLWPALTFYIVLFSLAILFPNAGSGSVTDSRAIA